MFFSHRLIPMLLLSILLAGCATAPHLDTAGVNQTITPDAAAADIHAAQGRKVQWGGTIITSSNLRQTTQIEVLGYPLQDNGRPDTTAVAQRRFLVLYNGYLETVDYAAGRLLTVVGQVAERRPGKIGDADYLYPVVTAQQLYLWPKQTEYYYNEPAFHFGIGIGIGL